MESCSGVVREGEEGLPGLGVKLNAPLADQRNKLDKISFGNIFTQNKAYTNHMLLYYSYRFKVSFIII